MWACDVAPQCWQNMSHTKLTEYAVSLQRAGLWQVGHDAHAVSSLPALIATQIRITDMEKTHGAGVSGVI